MRDEKGQAGGPHQHADARAAVTSLSRDRAVASSADPHPGNRIGLIRRVLHRMVHVWFLLSRGMTMGVRAVVLDREGRVFLVRHSYVPGWHFPGGGIELGQDALAALEMELREEGNLVLASAPQLFGVYFNPVASRRDHVLLYVVRAFDQTGPRAPDREIVETGFFSLDALPEGTTRATRQRLAEVFEGVAASPRW